MMSKSLTTLAAALAVGVFAVSAQAQPPKAMHGKMKPAQNGIAVSGRQMPHVLHARTGQEVQLCLPRQQGQDEDGQSLRRRRQKGIAATNAALAPKKAM